MLLILTHVKFITLSHLNHHNPTAKLIKLVTFKIEGNHIICSSTVNWKNIESKRRGCDNLEKDHKYNQVIKFELMNKNEINNFIKNSYDLQIPI